MAPQPVTVTLGTKEYSLQPLTIRKSKEWREALGAPLAQVVQALELAGHMQSLRLTDGNELAQIVAAVKDVLLGSIDQVRSWLYDYSPALAADREQIEEEAFDDEALAAFIVVLRWAYPFESLRGIFAPGRPSPATKTN